MKVAMAIAGALVLASSLTSPSFADAPDLATGLSLEFETPHTRWAKPNAQGTARILFLMPQGYAETREAVELLQRFDLEAQAVCFDGTSGKCTGGEDGMRRMLNLLEEEWDGYVFDRIAPDQLPREALGRVLAAVAKGKGLVIKACKPWEAVIPERKVCRPERIALPPGFEGFAVDNGRVVFIPEQAPVAYRFGWEVAYDHKMEQYGRALLWAAGKPPRMDLRIVLSESIPRTETPRTPIRLTWRDAPPATTIALQARRSDGLTITLWKDICKESAGQVEVGLPSLRAGDYFVEAVAEGASGVNAWATARLTIGSERSVASLALDQDWGEVGQRAQGRITLDGKPLEGESLEWRVSDRHGRILVKEPLGISGDRAVFDFEIHDWLPMLVRVEAVLLAGGEEVASRDAYLNVTKRQRNRFHTVVWGCPGGETGPFAVESMVKAGVTAVLAGGAPPPYLAAYDLGYVSAAGWLASDRFTLPGSLNASGIMGRQGCYRDRSYASDRGGAEASRPHGVLAYSLGDESAVRGSCLSPGCLQAYRQYLAGIYGDIAALNASWSSSYGSFEEISLLAADDLPGDSAPEWFTEYYRERTRTYQGFYPNRFRKRPLDKQAIMNGDQNDELAALRDGNFARWYDRQAYQTHNLVFACKQYREAFKGFDPDAWVGFEGTDSFAIPRIPTRIRQGGDVDLIVRELNYFAPYGNCDLIRSIAPAGFLSGNWIGYFPDTRRTVRDYWNTLLSGATTVHWWKWDGIGTFIGLLAPHYGLNPSRAAMVEDTRVVRDGLGEWLIRSRRVHDGIAVLYSLPSSYISHFDGNPTYGSYAGTQRAWTQAIRGLGLDYRYVTDRMLRLGEFDPREFKVLVLPCIPALGEKEAVVIRDFVKAGGVVIGDVRTGIYTDRCKARSDGVLDDVFGIRRDGKRDSRRAYLSLAAEHAGRRFAMGGKDSRIDPSVRPDGGTALGNDGGIPFFIVNDFGNGKAFYLNVAPSDESLDPALVRGMLAAAGVERAIGIEDAQAPMMLWEGAENTHVERVQDPETGRESVALTFYPEPTDSLQDDHVQLSSFPIGNWGAYDRLCFSVNTRGESPEGSLTVFCHNVVFPGSPSKRNQVTHTLATIGKTDGWREVCLDIGDLRRDGVVWLRIAPTGDRRQAGWTGRKPFTVLLDTMRLVKSAPGEAIAEPEEEPAPPQVAIPFVRNQRTVLKRWQNGGNQVIALQPERGDFCETSVTLPVPMHVYDLRKRCSLGFTREFISAHLEGRPNLYALLASPPPDMDIAHSGVRRGETLKVRVVFPGAGGSYAVKLKLRQPCGAVADWFEEVFVVGTEGKDLAVRMAFNAPPGQWFIEGTELFTGTTTRTPLLVE